jgi:hypothetical protein
MQQQLQANYNRKMNHLHKAKQANLFDFFCFEYPYSFILIAIQNNYFQRDCLTAAGIVNVATVIL